MDNNETNGGGNQPNQPVQPNQPNQKPKDKKRFNLMWIYAILFAVLIGFNFLAEMMPLRLTKSTKADLSNC